VIIILAIVIALRVTTEWTVQFQNTHGPFQKRCKGELLKNTHGPFQKRCKGELLCLKESRQADEQT
jgi:hypothetical protein